MGIQKTSINGTIKLVVPLFLFLILLSTIAIADIQTDYHETGTGTFATIETTRDIPITANSISEQGAIIPAQLYDLDEDGTKELIAVDGTNINLYYPNITANILNGINAYSNGDQLITNYYISDMNGSPVIYYVTEDQWHTLSWSGTAFTHANMSKNFENNNGGFGCGEDFIKQETITASTTSHQAQA